MLCKVCRNVISLIQKFTTETEFSATRAIQSHSTAIGSRRGLAGRAQPLYNLGTEGKGEGKGHVTPLHAGSIVRKDGSMAFSGLRRKSQGLSVPQTNRWYGSLQKHGNRIRPTRLFCKAVGGGLTCADCGPEAGTPCVFLGSSYRVSHEELSIFWEFIVSAILSKEVYMLMWPVLNSFQVKAIS
jgi:hypothetical protein